MVDYAPAGRYSPRSPTPSKVAVVFFYLSVAFCMIGCIMIVRAFFLKNVSVWRNHEFQVI